MASQIHTLGATAHFVSGSSAGRNTNSAVCFGTKLNNTVVFGLKMKSKGRISGNSRRSTPLRMVAGRVVGIDHGTKRFIGRKMLEVGEESKRVSYDVARDDNGDAKLEFPANGKQFLDDEISAQSFAAKCSGSMADFFGRPSRLSHHHINYCCFGPSFVNWDVVNNIHCSSARSHWISRLALMGGGGGGVFSRLYSRSLKCFAATNGAASGGTSVEGVSVLVIGGGGREHALCYAFRRSSSCDAVFCAPGNAGISNSGDATCVHYIDISDSSSVIEFCREWGIGLVVIGPEAPLVAGLANDLNKAGIPTFGPSSEAAALEGSKDFMKQLCDKYAIPTAKYRTFTDPLAAKAYIKDQGVPIVVKADGLAAGKGVIVAMTLEEACDAVDSMLVKNAFGSAGCRVIIEEYLEGEEASFFALVDGVNAIPLESAQDHKRVGDGDTGPNTGGMGAYSPAPVLTKDLQSVVMESIILPTVKGMAAEGRKFVGVLYAGLMIEKKSGLPKLIEYNVRFGDPECQVLMIRLKSDLAQVLLAACRGGLSGVTLDWFPGSAMVVVMASMGYPGSYKKGTVINNIEEAEQVVPTVKVFHAGTDLDAEGNYIATGGRVLGITAKGVDLEEARDRVYQAIEQIHWPGGFYRQDIGWRALPGKQPAVEG